MLDLSEGSPFEKNLRTATTIFILAYVLFRGSVMEASYPTRLVELYVYPWWRFLIIGIVMLGTYWCPRVGLALAIAVFFYLNDMHVLTSPFRNGK